MSESRPVEPWAAARGHLRRRGLRWTRQRQRVIEVLASSSGHLTGTQIVELCRAREPTTVPSTVYRTLDVLEELGLVRHGHGADGREEYHVRPADEHGHLYCEACGRHWELGDARAREFVTHIEQWSGVTVDLTHLTLVGRCSDCGRTRA